MGNVEAAQRGYARLKNCVIRPTRQVYSEAELGPSAFTFGGVLFNRVDFSLQNTRGMVLRCSHWRQADANESCLGGCNSADGKAGPPSDYKAPCIIYLHGNAGCRLDSKEVLPCALAMGCSFFALDFAGSGISEGEHVSLGWYEQHDLSVVVKHLSREPNVGRIVLWGRSMGAVTALLFAGALQHRSQVWGMILDSPFCDFSLVASQRVDHARRRGMFAPGSACLVPFALAVISSSIEAVAGFDPRKLDPLTAAKRSAVPALFLIADNDQFVPPVHGKRLYAVYGGAKGLLTFPGDHNSRRPPGLYEYVEKFLDPVLQVHPEATKPRGVLVHNDLRPPWTPPEKGQAGSWFGSFLVPCSEAGAMRSACSPEMCGDA